MHCRNALFPQWLNAENRIKYGVFHRDKGIR